MFNDDGHELRSSLIEITKSYPRPPAFTGHRGTFRGQACPRPGNVKSRSPRQRRALARLTPLSGGRLSYRGILPPNHFTTADLRRP